MSFFQPGLVARAALCAAGLSLSCPPLFAQGDAVQQQIVVTANRVGVPVAQALADIVVIDDTVLREAAGRTLEEVLRERAGVQLSRTGPPGQTAGVFIRGASMSNVVVLIDGVRVGSATLGQAALESLGLAAIERIEVLRGPGSALYGADAVGGVIQVFTRRAGAAPRAQAALHVGGYGSNEGNVGASGKFGSVDAALTLSREASDSVSALNPGDAFNNFNPDRDGFTRRTASAQLGGQFLPGQRLGVQLLDSRLRSQYDAAEFAPPDFLPDPSPDFRNRLHTRTLAVTHRADSLPGGLRSELALSESRDELDSGGNTIDRFDTRRRQLSWQPSIALGTATLVGVLEASRTQVRSSSFGADVRRSTNNALGFSAFGPWGSHRWQVDLRRDDHDVYGGQTTGKLGYAWQAGAAWTLRAAAGTAFRAPSFNELYFPDFGVETIRPERARSVEAGVAFREGATTAQLTAYDNRVRDLIGFEADPAACPPGYAFGCARNIDRARLRGVSAEAGSRLGALSWRVAAEYLDARDRASGERLTRRARHSGSGEMAWDGGAWGVAAVLNGVGSRVEGGERQGAYELLDLRAHWSFATQWRLEAKLLNALDRRYEPVKDYGALGRQAWIGVRFDTAGF
jgi:vitamin B12 transporter